MKKFLIILSSVFLFSCGEKTIKSSNGVDIDSLLKQSEKNFTVVNEANKKSDTAITTKVDKTVEKIGNLENEVKQLKAENEELKDKLDDATDAGKSYHIRAISDSKNN